MSISCEASSTFHATSFQNEHFVRGFLNFSSNKLPKRVFRAKPPQLFKQQASKTSISCEASSTFQATSFQNEHFVRGFLNFLSDKLPKRAFRARPLQLFKQQAFKTSISCEASSTFQATSFQNEHFVRGLFNFSSNKLPKQAFRARPPQLFNQQTSKTSISCEASSTFQATNFQNEHFVRGCSTFQRRNFPNLAPAAFPRPPAGPPGDVPRNIFAKDVSRNHFGSLSARPPARRRVQKYFCHPSLARPPARPPARYERVQKYHDASRNSKTRAEIPRRVQK